MTIHDEVGDAVSRAYERRLLRRAAAEGRVKETT